MQINNIMSAKDFVVLCKLGEGAYSTVYKVERLADKKVYALKKVKLGNLSEKEIENALNEVRILASLRNNQVVAYKQAFLEGKNLCIVMEFADDGDLYQKIVAHKKESKLFEEQQIWNTLVQILLGLKGLHVLNILHRDLKSANIFLNKSGVAKLGDLNVSKVAKNGLLYTQTGTPYYASPEVWKDQPYDSKSDIWSLGCVIYEMTTLQPPFQAEDMEGLMKAVTLGMYPPINPKFSRELAQVIKLMLQQHPNKRPSADTLLNSSLIQQKIQELHFQVQGMGESLNQELLKTIRIPKKLHYLTDRLPKPNYENLSDPGQSLQNSQQLQRNYKGSLPKLKNVLHPSPSKIQSGLSVKLPDNKKRRGREQSILMIEGRSKIIGDVKSQDKPSKHLDRQIREELKKIYKVRQPGRSYDHRSLKREERSIICPQLSFDENIIFGVGSFPTEMNTEDREVVRKLKLISLISLFFMTIQIVGGIFANSISILADAFHLMSDVLAYVISMQAVLLSHRLAPKYLTFGYHKAQPLGALLNVAIIWFVTIELLIQATQRIINKEIVEEPIYMFLTSIFGLFCNLYIMKVLHSEGAHGCSHNHGPAHNHGHDQSHSHEQVQRHNEHGDSEHRHKHDEHGHQHNEHGHKHNEHGHQNNEHGHQHKKPHQHHSGCSHQHSVNQKLYKQMTSAEDMMKGNEQMENPCEGTQKIPLDSNQVHSDEQLGNSDACLHEKKSFFRNINIEAAYVHIISDIILSVGVIVSASIIYFKAPVGEWTYWQLADPFCTYFFSVMAIYSTISIVKDSVIILLDGCEDPHLVDSITQDLSELPEVHSYRDLRVWSLNRDKHCGAVQVVSKNPDIYGRIKQIFNKRDVQSYIELTAQAKEE